MPRLPRIAIPPMVSHLRNIEKRSNRVSYLPQRQGTSNKLLQRRLHFLEGGSLRMGPGRCDKGKPGRFRCRAHFQQTLWRPSNANKLPLIFRPCRIRSQSRTRDWDHQQYGIAVRWSGWDRLGVPWRNNRQCSDQLLWQRIHWNIQSLHHWNGRKPPRNLPYLRPWLVQRGTDLVYRRQSDPYAQGCWCGWQRLPVPTNPNESQLESLGCRR